jgi:hypothetical protein
MPGKARIDASGALHHIICRGIERRTILRMILIAGIIAIIGHFMRHYRATKGFDKPGIVTYYS